MAKQKSWRDYYNSEGSSDSGEQTISWRDYLDNSGNSFTGGGEESIEDRVDRWLRLNNTYLTKYNNRYAGRSFDYKDPYISDSSNWLQSATSHSEALEKERREILSYLNQNKDYIDSDWAASVRLTLANEKKKQNTILDQAIRENDYWKQFNPNEQQLAEGLTAEDIYKQWQQDEEAYALDLDYDVKAAEQRLSLLKVGRESYLAQPTEPKNWIEGLGGRLFDNLAINIARGLENRGTYVTPYGTEIAELEERIQRARDVQQYENQLAFFNSYTEMPDFDTKSAYKSTYRGGEEFHPVSGLYLDTGFDDIVYDYINGNQLARDRMNMESVMTNTRFLGLDMSYLEQMTEDKIKMYNYLYEPGNTRAADQYLQFLLSDLNYRRRKSEETYWAAEAKEHPFGASAFSIAMSPAKGLSAIGQVADYLDDGKIDQNAGYNAHSYIPTAIRNQVASDIEKSGKWGKAGSWTYQLGMSMGDFLMTSAVSGGNSTISLALMGTGAMADTVIASKDRGLSDDQALALGVVAGGAEIITEKLSLDALFNGDLTKGAVKYILTNAFTEGTEEVSSSLINLYADIIISKDKSQWQMEINDYLAKHPNASESEAFRNVLTDTAMSLGLDFIGGYLMGGGMGGGGAAINYVTEAAPFLQKNKDAVKNYGHSTKELIAEGLASDPDSKSYDLAKYYEKKKAKGKELSGYEIRNLVEANEAQFVVENYNEALTLAKKKLTDLGETENVDKIAELVAKRVTGEELTAKEKSTLVRSQYGSKVAKEMKHAASDIAYKSHESRFGKDARFGISQSGKTVVRQSNEELDTNKLEVKTVGDGRITFDVKGEEVSAGHIDFADADTSYLVSAVSNIEHITPDAASVAIHSYDPSSKQTVGEYINGFDEAFTYGYYNYSVADLKAGNFTTNLTNEQMMSAYELGKAARKRSTDIKEGQFKAMRTAAQAAAEKSVAKGKQVEAKNLTITYDKGNGEIVPMDEAFKDGELDEKRSAAFKVAEILHKLGLGTKIEFFSSYISETMKVKNKKTGKMENARVFLNEDGVEQLAYSGVYRNADGTIRVDLNAYNGRGLTLNTLAHELTHFIQQWSTKKYKVLVDFLMQEYENTDLTMNDRVLREQKRLEEIRGKEVSYDEAYDEVVANAMSKMFDDGNLVEQLTKLKAQDMTLVQKLWEGFKKIMAEFLGIYEKEGALFQDAADLMQMKDTFEQLQNMFAEALVEASENYQAYLTAEESGALAEAGIGFDPDTRSVYSLNFSTAYTENVQVGKKSFNTEAIAQLLSKATGRSIADVTKWINSERTIANMVMENPEFLDFEADNRYEAIKKNSDYPQGTVDLSNLCPKREEFTTMFDMLQKKYPNKLFTAQDVAEMRKILADNDITVACGACFVEDRRQLLGEIADTYINMWKEAVESGKPLQKTNAAGVKSDLLVTRALAKQYGLTAGTKIMATDSYIPTQYDLTTYEGFKLLEKNHPTIAMGFNRYNNSRGQQSARLIEGRAEYKRQILGWSDAKVRSVNNNGGLRIFSFSDFEVVHLLDLVQVIIDCSARGVKIQGYTKIPAFAKLVRNTGIKLNRSLIPSGDYGYHMENGKVVLDFDSKEGIDINDENFVDESKNPNVGNIVIGINPTQIGAAMLDPFIDYIIPFHSNKSKEILKKLGTGEWINYKESQHDKDQATGKAAKHNVNIYTEVINKYHPKNKVEFVEAFLKECKRQGKTPRYAEFLNVNANGDYAYREGYHKLLVDFKMFDAEGNILPQGNITPNLNDGFMTDLLKAEVDKKKSYEFPQGVYKAIDKKFGEQYSSQETDLDKFDAAEYHRIKISGSEQQRLEREAMTWNADKVGKVIYQTLSNQYTYVYYFDEDHNITVLNKYQATNIHERQGVIDDKRNRAKTGRNNGGYGSKGRTDTSDVFGTDGGTANRSNRSPEKAQSETQPSNRRGYAEGTPDTDKAGVKEQYSSQETDADNVPTFYSQMAKVVDAVKQEKLGAASVVNMLRGKGVKAEEIKWSGIEEWLSGKKSVTKAELQEFIAGSQLQIDESVRDMSKANKIKVRKISRDSLGLYVGGELAETFTKDSDDQWWPSNPKNEDDYYVGEEHILWEFKDVYQPRWSKYTIKGGKNYRELVFSLPNATHSNDAMEAHWGINASGIIAHARIQDFKVHGKKMLFVEEIQSDWHNEGHTKGYAEKGLKTESDIRKESANAYRAFHQSNIMQAVENRVGQSDYNGSVVQLISDVFDGNNSAYSNLAYFAQLTSSERAFIDKTIAEERKRQDAIKTAPKNEGVPDAPFRDTYQEFVMKRLIREAAENGYDSIGWTPAEVQSERWSDDFAEGYRIEYDQEIPKFMRKYGKKWGAEVGTTTLKNGTEVWSMDITDAMKKSVLTEGQAMYSEHDTDYSNRSLLANAFEGITKSSDEYKLVQEYKGHIRLLNEYEEKLANINAEIHNIRFTKGEYDAKKLKELEAKAKNIASEINKHDSKLLSLEASEPLRKLIEQERKKEALKTIDHVKEIVQNKKDRAEQTELRHKIRRTVRDLDKILNRGNKKQNVKQDMKGFVSKALELADFLFTDHVSNDELIRNGITVRMTPREAALVEETQEILSQLYDNADNLTDEEFTRLDEKRKANEDKLRDLLTAQRNERLSTPVYNLFNDLVTEYASFKNSKQDGVKDAYDPKVERFLRSYIGEADGETDSDRATLLKNMRVADMTTDELWKLHNAYKMVLHSVRSANELWVEGQKETVQQVTDSIASDFSKKTKPKNQAAIVAVNMANKLGWNYEKLYYALDRIGSKSFTKLFENLANSENIIMQDVREASEFIAGVVNDYGYNDWKVNKKIDHDFVDNTGKEFRLTLGELMSLYAYSKREGAWDHIEYGGFVFGKKSLKDPKPADSYKLTKKQVESMTSMLTNEQKKYVDAMQKYLSETMGAKGNEVSMRLYGIEMFTEKNYFPIHIAGQFKAQAQESQAKAAAGFGTMSNAGFTHAQNKNAKAPFVLESFNEVWVDHVNEMSRYHGAVPALEDIRRVMNRSSYFTTDGDSFALKQLMENAFGESAVKYFDNLYKEANSGAITDKLQDGPKKLLSMFRKNSVAYSASVLIQQPTSIIRAHAMIDRKYFGVKGFGTITSGVVKLATNKWTKAHTNAYAEMLKYAPGVTLAKEIGGFDTHTGGSIRSYLLDTDKTFAQKMKTGKLGEKGKAVLDLVDDNFIANLPNLADKIAWIEIWNACKRETVAKHKDLATNSDEFMQVVGDRFTEVIRATQVYDSIFAKSPIMKSKSLAVQYLVSFMNEPNTTTNMAESALRDALRGNWKDGAKKAAVLAYGTIATVLAKSLIYAMRDDDEEKTYMEKYFASVADGLMNDFNPINYIPIARDVSSAMQGYDIERPDMAVVVDAIEAVKSVVNLKNKLDDDLTEEELAELEEKMDEANWRVVESLGAFLGVPVKNVRRDVVAVFNKHSDIGQGTKLSFKHTIEQAINDSKYFFFRDENKSKNDKLYEAIMAGDATYVERMRNSYDDADSYNAAVRKALRENDPRIKQAAQAQIDGYPTERVHIQKLIIADGFDINNVIAATNSEIASLTPDEPGNAPNTPKEVGHYTAEDFAIEISNGNFTSANTIKNDVINTHIKNNMTEEEAEKKFKSDAKSEMHDMFKNGKLSEKDATKALTTLCGLDDDEAYADVQYWKYKKNHPDADVDDSWFDTYYDKVEDSGIGIDIYMDYRTKVRGVDNKDERMKIIDSLPITRKQKDALYLAEGWAKNKLYQAPW